MACDKLTEALLCMSDPSRLNTGLAATYKNIFNYRTIICKINKNYSHTTRGVAGIEKSVFIFKSVDESIFQKCG